MRGGSLPLAAVLAATWGLVYLVTQVFADPPLGVGTTVVAGVILTLLLTLGYPSALRGPRVSRASRVSRLPRTRRGPSSGSTQIRVDPAP